MDRDELKLEWVDEGDDDVAKQIIEFVEDYRLVHTTDKRVDRDMGE